MEYGRVPYGGLKEQDFVFDTGMAQPFLPGNRAIATKLYWGFPHWGRKEWRGTFYPHGSKDAQFLDHYLTNFNAVELNASHYTMPEEDRIRIWAAKAAGLDFLFCPKVLNEITHLGNLSEKEPLMQRFITRVLGFGKHLGPLLFQVSDKFSPERADELRALLETVSIPLHVEVRHPNWYAPAIMTPFLEYLHTLKMGLVITDTPGHRTAICRQLAGPNVLIRFVGGGDHPLDDFRIAQWKNQLTEWLELGLERCYFFLQLYEQNKAFEFSEKVKAALEPLFVQK